MEYKMCSYLMLAAVVIFLLLPSPVLFSTASSITESPIIIERSSNSGRGGIEFADLLLDYNRHLSPKPHRSIPIDIGIQLVHVSWNRHQMHIAFHLMQVWKDARLAFNGGRQVMSLPPPFQIWLPNTIPLNTIEWQPANIVEHSLTLTADGTIIERQKLSATIPCHTAIGDLLTNDGVVNCTIEFGAYDETNSESSLAFVWTSIDYRQLNNIISIENSTMVDVEATRAVLHVRVQTTMTRAIASHLLLAKSDL